MSQPFHRLLPDAFPWASVMFGGADLGDHRLRNRLVAVAAGVAQRPAGRVTQVFATTAERQGAYGLLENDDFPARAIQDAMGHGVAAQVTEAGLRSVYVVLDGSSIRVRDPKGVKGTGRVGSAQKKARGFEVMSALVLDEHGVPQGLASQTYWTRTGALKRKNHTMRPLAEKETRFWLEGMTKSLEHFEAARRFDEPAIMLHFLMDRGADARYVLAEAAALREAGRADTTLRVAYNRRIQDPEVRYLRDRLALSAVRCESTLRVEAGPDRKARIARMEVRSCTVTLILKDPRTDKKTHATLNVVLTREVGTTPVGEKPIEWLLFTTRPVATVQQVCDVIRAYSFRWRIEEFHKTWKSGLCRVQDTQLRSAAAIQKWAMILAAVAVRAVQLSYAARHTPEAPAGEALTDAEIDAVIVLRRPEGFGLGDRPALHLVVRWIADIGGYTGKSSGGPPGPIVIGRGLREVESAARTIANLQELKGKANL